MSTKSEPLQETHSEIQQQHIRGMNGASHHRQQQEEGELGGASPTFRKWVSKA